MIKSKILPAAVTAVLGFAIGWAAKPSAAKQDSTAETPAEATKNSRPDRQAPPLILPQRNGERPKASPEGEATLTRIRSSTTDMIRNGERAREQRLAEALGLNQDQQEQLAELAKKYRSGFRDLSRNAQSATDLIQSAAESEKAYNEEVSKVLDPEQAAAYDAMRDRKKSNEIEGNAQQVLADISLSADISSEQREAVLAKLRENAEKAYDNRPAGYDFMTQNNSVFGNKLATSVDNPAAVMTLSSEDPAEYQRRMNEQIDETSRNRVELLRGILTPAQLREYQTSLQSRQNFGSSFQMPASK